MEKNYVVEDDIVMIGLWK